ANLPERHKNVKVIFFDEIDSTNNECKRMLANGFCETAIIIAEKQNSGRGRQGKSFYSPPKTGIYFSVILDPMVKLANSVTVTAAASVAVLRAIKDTTGILAQIKWVNDIYFNNKKICGILTEAITDFESQTVQNIIIGVGINVFTSEIPDSLGNIASSLGSSQLNRSKILAAAASNLLDMDVSKGLIPYLDEYRANSVLLGRKIDYYVNTVLYHATVVGISDDGGLMIENENGTSDILKSGEISVKFL
ncbi:MAG: biotin--[acetyl-CoA-carboxylase] ligase, partial [Clostridia bacterium]